ncbi:MAG: hypothetical protein ACI8SR_002533 [Oceanicoccus sp.]|jgi:hypothetical protein
MKHYFFSLLLLIPNIAFAKVVEHSDTALEANGMKVEFFDSSETGIIRPINCNLCLLEFYNFDNKIKINKSGTPIPLKTFMDDYWNAQYPTLFIDPRTNTVKKINY